MGALKNHPGMWLRDDAANALNALEDKYGPIVINSAGRTVAEQNELIRRWNVGGTYNRPPYLYEPARPAEASNHVANGGIAIDVYNYTSDRAKLEEFGFQWYGNSDKVHYTYVGHSTPGIPVNNRVPGESIYRRLRWYGVQCMLKVEYGYTGKIDNDPGPGTLGALDRFFKAKGYWDGGRWSSAQRWLKATGRYSGLIDDDWGQGSFSGWARAENENWHAYHRRAGV